jgi:hypothetical protein
MKNFLWIEKHINEFEISKKNIVKNLITNLKKEEKKYVTKKVKKECLILTIYNIDINIKQNR